MSRLYCTISGSFRRFLPQISATISECNDRGIIVLSPRSGEFAGEVNGFVFVEGDRGDPKDIEEGHLQAIRQSDFLYIVNPSGYIGPSAMLEIGYAISFGVPVFAFEIPTESVVQLFISGACSIEKVKDALAKASNVEIPRRADLPTLQAYIRKVVDLRGFNEESLRDVVLLLVEEVGELAKAVRRETGLKVAGSELKSRKSIAHELADCLIYLLDIANLAEIDLDDAFRTKERINSLKEWVSER